MSRRAVLALVSATTMTVATAFGLTGAFADEVQPPTDPIAKAAFDVLSKHCSRCHQDGKLVDRLKPAKNFGNILNLDQIAKTPQLILPGNPDGSLIFNQVAKQAMPYDLYQEAKLDVPEPTADELKALRAWIENLGKQQAAACETRRFLTNGDVVAAIAEDLKKAPNNRVKGTRYLTLTNLYNVCTDDQALNVYRQGAVKLINSLSRSSDVVRLETIDPEKTIIRFNLVDIGWEDSDWNAVLTAYPYRVKPDDKLFDFVQQASNTQLPYVRADWFAFTAAQPGLYNALLKLPKDFKGLQQQIGADVDADIAKQSVARAGFQVSGVSQHNRMIERHQVKTGYLWTSYDFGGDKDHQDLFEFPLGPSEAGFHHNGGESIFSLPNGFQAYYLNNDKGVSLDKGPTNIVRDLSRKDLAVTNGISCMGCHDQGIRPDGKDQIREHVLADKTSFPKDVREAVDALYPGQEKIAALYQADGKRFRAAEEQAGLDPGLKFNGIEMTNALSAKYEANVDGKLAAAEYGLKPEALQKAVAGSAEANALMRRLAQGLVPREQFEVEFAKLLPVFGDDTMMDAPKSDQAQGQAGAAQAVAVAKPKSNGDGTSQAFDFSLTSDKSVYKQNDRAIFTVVAQKDCRLTLTNVDGKGQGTIIFPNQFQQDNQITAGKEFKFGDASTPFTFRLADKGTETVIADCALPEAATRGLKATNKDGGFTNLGNFSEALTRQIVVDGQKTKQNAGPPAQDVAAAAAKKTPGVVRTAIKLAVE